LPSESLVQFEREIDLRGKVTYNVQLFEGKKSDDTQLIFGGHKKIIGKKVINTHFSSLEVTQLP
jgi:hypothetical protein